MSSDYKLIDRAIFSIANYMCLACKKNIESELAKYIFLKLIGKKQVVRKLSFERLLIFGIFLYAECLRTYDIRCNKDNATKQLLGVTDITESNK